MRSPQNYIAANGVHTVILSCITVAIADVVANLSVIAANADASSLKYNTKLNLF